MADFTVHPHAARRWCERVFGLEAVKITENDMTCGFIAVAIAMESTASVLRYDGSKRRVFVTPEGIHLLVAPGRVVLSVLPLDRVTPGCPCEGCLAKLAQQLRDGVPQQSRHGVLSRLDGFKDGHHHARRHKRRQG